MKIVNKSLLIIICFTGSFINAQDSHYWTNQYGTEASLLGGLVVGSKHDLSSTFYNPGTLALTTDQVLTISSDAYQITQVNITSKSPTVPNLESNTSGSAPGIVAFRLQLDSLGKNQIAFSVLVKDVVEADFYGRNITRTDISSISAHDGIIYEDNFETWIGFSWGRKIKEKMGIGISQYVALRANRQRLQIISQILEDPQTAATRILFNDTYFNNLKILWKAGIFFDYRPLSFGLTVTTPSVNLFNYTGESSINISQINSAGEEQFIAVNDEEGLTSVFKTPFSIALGAAYHLEKTSLYFSAEWFAKINSYDVLNTKPVIVVPDSEIIPNNNSLSRRSVINFGVGINHKLIKNFSLYASIFTNNSARDPNNLSKYSLSGYNILHFLGGVAFKYDIIDLILGLGYATGNSKIEPLDKIINPEINTSGTGVNDSEITYRGYKIVFAFSINV
ncbi:MAG: hypothetical protein OQJ78_07210 [Ignavibacteriaceae bacterium]|nr:hypothetical protein [Ignavibacteriaceae bacterium]